MRLAITFAFVVLCASLALAEDSKPDAKVTIKKVAEQRELELEKSPFAGWNTGVTVTLHVDGPAVKDARKVGKIQIKKATDDAGTDLNKAAGDAPRADPDRFEDVREPQSFSMDDNAKKPTGFDLELRLPNVSARGAKSISVNGDFQVLVGGEKKVVEIKSIKQQLGKTLDDPALKAAGITFTIVDPGKRGVGEKLKAAVIGGDDDADKSFPVIISGEMDALGEVSLVDASGEKLNNSSFWNDDAGKRSITYSSDKPIPKDATLKIEVFPGQKKVTVPFEIKDQKLP